MGFIKSIRTAMSSQYADQFKEVIKYDGNDTSILIKRVTTDNGVIQNQSRLFVQPGQCAIFTDNGAIKDIITEPGMYFMDTSAPTLFQTNIFKGLGSTILEGLKRIAYQGEVINQQFVYFISLTEKIGLRYNIAKPILYKDPEWGPMELFASGEYALKINNPVNLLTNVSGDKDVFLVEELSNVVNPYIVAGVTADIASLGVSFDTITSKQDEIGAKVIASVSEKLDTLGLEVTKIVVANVDVTDEVKKSMRERTSIKMKATSTNSDEADIYTKLNQAEAMKDLANNPNNAGTTIMGMNMGQMFGGMIKDEKKGE